MELPKEEWAIALNSYQSNNDHIFNIIAIKDLQLDRKQADILNNGKILFQAGEIYNFLIII